MTQCDTHPTEVRHAEPARPDHCLDCGAEATANFCPECGQETRERLVPVGDLVRDVVEEFLKFDARVIRTVVPLLFKPGFLTLEYLAGRRTRYVPPFKLFFFVSAVWLLLFVMTGMDRQILSAGKSPAPAGITAGAPAPDPETARLDRAMDQGLEWYFSNQSVIAFLMVPVLALLLKGLYPGQKRLYVEHLVFAVHLNAFLFLGGLMLFVVPESWDLLFFGWCVAYVFLALRRVYAEGPVRTLIKEAGFFAGVVIINLLVVLGAGIVFSLRGS